MSSLLRINAVLLAGLVILACGCGGARYVVREPDRGIVAIPSNTPKNQAKAAELMLAHFPQGYVIDDEQEAQVGHWSNAIQYVGPWHTYAMPPRHEWYISYHGMPPIDE
jgi:hypothetical protein